MEIKIGFIILTFIVLIFDVYVCFRKDAEKHYFKLYVVRFILLQSLIFKLFGEILK